MRVNERSVGELRLLVSGGEKARVKLGCQAILPCLGGSVLALSLAKPHSELKRSRPVKFQNKARKQNLTFGRRSCQIRRQRLQKWRPVLLLASFRRMGRRAGRLIPCLPSSTRQFALISFSKDLLVSRSQSPANRWCRTVHTGMAKNKRQPYAVSEKAGEQTSAESWGTGTRG
jgi:hypothetical protein